MNISKYMTKSVENDRYQQHSLELHQKRLKEINSKSSGLFTNQTVYKILKRKNNDSGIIYKERELEYQNQKLLKKLIGIAKNTERQKIRSLTPIPKTLNSINRKREACRILEENKRIANRIAKKLPMLSSKVLEKEYETQNKYREILVKYSLLNQKKSLSIKRLESSEKSYQRI